ncbi:MAG: VRR-NUC domain-containing protein [Steroidobacteraceae bacterium]|nr:VRR-NUC domain-containing protein [Steroidobacteraceae bacterium]MDW8259364.1 VRR-NUC domain-containing protein [Gammaproteobacteria bacterium]
MIPESLILTDIRLNVSKGPIRVFRNNVGALMDKHGNYITYGLAPGSSDLIGWRTITVTRDMLGAKIAQFLSIEVKSLHGVVTQEQQAWLDLVERAGGIAIVARSLKDVTDALAKEKK